jgi:[protein-PII] uridylyltransferase
MQKTIEKLRHRFRAGRSELFRNASWVAPSRDLLEKNAALVDGLLREIHQISCDSADHVATRSKVSGLAIVATGGYGRRELNPYSDIDIAFIPSEEDDPWLEAAVHTAFKLVMDVFLSLRDVHVGYSFRPASETTAWDLTTKTALLDLRYVCGDRALAQELATRIRQTLSPLDIMLEAQSGSQNNGRSQSLYSVEPNLKEGAGSLRDLHRARWIFKLLLGVEDDGLESALCGRGIISERQINEVRKAADWFWRSRTWLHLAAGRLNDVLITNYQDRIARELGDCSAQDWLSRHFAHSEILMRFRETAVRTLLRGPLKISGVRLEDGSLHPENPFCSGSEVSLFHCSQRYSIPVSLADLSRLQDAQEDSLQAREASAEEIWAFNSILNEPENIAATLRALAKNGLMDRFIPGFSETMRFVPPDPAHRYTVGEHSLRMIEHLELLRSARDSGGHRFSDILNQCSHFDMLCLASLIHDAGKLTPGRDHCEASAELAQFVASRLALAPEKSELLNVLVREHLLLVRTARLHDLKSSNVIQKVAERVPSMETLRHLYVLTYVDTSAVSEGNWTSMDVRDLEDLYRKMQDFFSKSAEAMDNLAVEDRIGVIRKKLAALHPSKNEAAVLKHCETMSSSYVLNTPLEEITFHLQLLERLESENVVLDVYNRPGDDYSELTVCTYDDPAPGMLAKITGVLYGCGADIHKAQAFTLQKAKPVILDTLWIRSNGRQISENRARRIRATLKDVLTGTRKVERILEEAGKTVPKGILLDSIDLRNDLSEEHTVVHIVARDLQGLLYIMTKSLSHCGLDIHSAKIATWNARAENNFYVTAAGGGQIANSDLPLWTDRLAAVLQGIVQTSP